MKSVERIRSKVSIKPSTSTPEHLRSFKLSLLDQISPPEYIPIILFYSASPTGSTSNTHYEHQAHVSDRLKKSLSKTLTHFYPIAGRLKDNLLVDCNDEGIEYFECRLNGNISEFMKQDQLHHLLPPYDLYSTLKIATENDPQLIAQVSLFGCGGIAICVCISHKIGDVATFTTFINTWASITREPSAEAIVNLTFDSAILYPPREAILSYSAAMNEFYTNIKQAQEQGQAEKMVTKRFVFDGAKIAILRGRYGNASKEMFPTRVEAVTALIWKTAMAANSSPKPSFARFPLDMRRRLDPPLPEQSFGNLLIMSATTTPFISENTGEVDLVGSLRESMLKINDDSLKVLQGDEGFLKFQDYLMKSVEHGKEMEEYSFTSWCRFPFYEADFGWGKPNWVTTAVPPFFKNACVLMDNRTGDGIEAIICLKEEHMAIFEQNQELLDFTSFSE